MFYLQFVTWTARAHLSHESSGPGDEHIFACIVFWDVHHGACPEFLDTTCSDNNTKQQRASCEIKAFKTVLAPKCISLKLSTNPPSLKSPLFLTLFIFPTSMCVVVSQRFLSVGPQMADNKAIQR